MADSSTAWARLPAWLVPTRRRFVLTLIVVLAVWAWFDVRMRGVIDPTNTGLHKTDFTVYTEAGAAFFDGRDPYAVTNVRGWRYLYPPLFAMLAAPLHPLSGEAQVLVWFALSSLLAWGCYAECARIARAVLPQDRPRGRFGPAPDWIGWCAILAALVPALNCLQRGQVGIAKLYLLLLGFRLLIASERRIALVLSGVVFAFAIVLKVTPVVPVAFVLGQQLVTSWRAGAERLPRERAGLCVFGTAAGLLAFVLLIPAALVGWNANLKHLDTWRTKIASHAESTADGEIAGDPTSKRNQSFDNAVHLGGNWLSCHLFGGADYDGPDQLRKGGKGLAMDARGINETLTSIRYGAVGLLLVVGYRLARSRDLLAHAVLFSLACVATLIVAQIARAHYFVLLLPGTMFLPVWLLEHGRRRWGVALAVLPPFLTLAHYTMLGFAGRLGVLGVGTMAWYLAGCALLLTTCKQVAADAKVILPFFHADDQVPDRLAA